MFNSSHLSLFLLRGVLLLGHAFQIQAKQSRAHIPTSSLQSSHTSGHCSSALVTQSGYQKARASPYRNDQTREFEACLPCLAVLLLETTIKTLDHIPSPSASLQNLMFLCVAMHDIVCPHLFSPDLLALVSLKFSINTFYFKTSMYLYLFSTRI